MAYLDFLAANLAVFMTGSAYAALTPDAGVGISGNSSGAYAGGVPCSGQPGSLQLSSATDLPVRTAVGAALATPSSSILEPGTVAMLGARLFGLDPLQGRQA